LQADGAAAEDVEVLDVAQMLLASVRRAPPGGVSVPAEPTRGGKTASEAAQAETAQTAQETDPIEAVLPADAPVSDPGTTETSARAVTPIPSPDDVAHPDRP
jgi:hypothetical protein